jgi:glycosyltransferase involved in cell wall biosynthesis
VKDDVRIRPSVSIIICALNEEQNLPHVLQRIPTWVNDVVLVDGHSKDATIAVAQQVRPDIRILVQPGKGKGDALKYGIGQAKGEIIATLDADGATDPEELSKFIEPLIKGSDFAKGSRFRKGFPRSRPLHRVMGNWIITLTFDILFFRPYTDLCSGYNVFWRKSIDKIMWPDDGYENEPTINCLAARNHLKVTEVAHSDHPRLRGNVKELAWRQGFKAVKGIVRERFSPNQVSR